MHFCICNVLISTTCGVLAKTQVHSSFLEAKKENKTTLSSDVIQQQHGHDYSFARHPSFYNNTIIETRKERGSPAFYLCFNKVVEAKDLLGVCLFLAWVIKISADQSILCRGSILWRCPWVLTLSVLVDILLCSNNNNQDSSFPRSLIKIIEIICFFSSAIIFKDIKAFPRDYNKIIIFLLVALFSLILVQTFD